jgi:hypothetical protein
MRIDVGKGIFNVTGIFVSAIAILMLGKKLRIIRHKFWWIGMV